MRSGSTKNKAYTFHSQCVCVKTAWLQHRPRCTLNQTLLIRSICQRHTARYDTDKYLHLIYVHPRPTLSQRTNSNTPAYCYTTDTQSVVDIYAATTTTTTTRKQLEVHFPPNGKHQDCGMDACTTTKTGRRGPKTKLLWFHNRKKMEGCHNTLKANHGEINTSIQAQCIQVPLQLAYVLDWTLWNPERFTTEKQNKNNRYRIQ